VVDDDGDDEDGDWLTGAAFATTRPLFLFTLFFPDSNCPHR